MAFVDTSPAKAESESSKASFIRAGGTRRMFGCCPKMIPFVFGCWAKATIAEFKDVEERTVVAAVMS